ncbi:MAG: hypothetical protein JST73_11070 [Actinobacteria bacterium]|nr:hypothetical protein [Actinomycetota bacterium]
MAFGQSAGPPASHRQIAELLALLQQAGHTDFRDARGPMGFTQRQGNGKFTRDEADAFIDLLTDQADAPADLDAPPTPRPARERVTAAERIAATQAREIHKYPSELLAAELQRRGWAVIEP